MIGAIAARIPKPTGVVATRVKSWSMLGWSLKGWSIPLAFVGGWMVYPALTTEFKQTLGLHNLGVVPAPADEE